MNQIERARNLYKEGKFRESKELFDREYQKSKTNESLFWSAVCDSELNHFEAALGKLNLLMDSDPDNCHVYNQTGMITFKLNDFDTARMMFNKAIDKNPKFKDAYYNVLETISESDHEQKFGVFLKILDQYPEEEEALLSAINIIEQTDRHKEELPSLIELLNNLDPGHPYIARYRSLLIRQADVKLSKTTRPLNILFLQNTPCIRNYKYAQALRLRGHNVTLAYTDKKLSEVYRGLSENTYNNVIKIVNFRDLWDISKNFDLIHSHNEPDTLTVTALAGQCPVIHDTHDLISLRDLENPNVKYFEGIANRGAHGLIYSTPYQKSEAKFLYGVHNPSLVFYNFVSAGDLPAQYLPKLSEKDGQVHIVYEGGIYATKHRNFVEIFTSVAGDNIHIHIYPMRFDTELENIFRDYPNIHYYHPVSPKRIIYEMSQYDFGIIPWNLDAGQKRFLDSTIANKLFEYLAAGLPVFTSNVQSYVDYFKDHPVGMIFYSAEDLIEKIPRLQKQVKDLNLSEFVHTYESEVEKLEDFYHEVIAAYSKTEKHVHRVSCPVCKSENTREVKHFNNHSLYECTHCMVRFADPLPDERFLQQWYSAEVKKQRWNNDLNAAIEANHKENETLYPAYFDIISRGIDLTRGGRVLEIGCYTGLFLTFFDAERFECIGIDLNEGFVEYGRKEFNLDLRHGDVFAQKFPEESFDLIIFNQVLEHISDPFAFLTELKRITKTDGYICFSVPNCRSAEFQLIEKFLPEEFHYGYSDYPNHLFYYDKNSLSHLFKNSGFEMTMLSTYENPANVHDKPSFDQTYQELSKTEDDTVFANKLNQMQKDLIHKLALARSAPSDQMSGVFGIFRKTEVNVSLNGKPKICHIGGAHSIHVADLVNELDRLGYEQCIISYMPVEKSITPRHIPVYYFNYKIPGDPKLLDQLQQELVKYLKFVFEKEKPGLIHGHSHTYSALPLWLAKTEFKFNTLVSPWSTYTMKNHHNPIINDIERKCLRSVDKILYGSIDSYRMFMDFYKNIDENKLVFFRPLLPMELYEKPRIILREPRILSVRVMGELYRQDLLIKALPVLLRFNPDIKVTFLVGQHAEQGMPYFRKMKELAEQLGVGSHCHFIDRSLDKEEFADMVYRHNIIYAVSSHDEGYSGSATLAMYSGAITLVQKTEENKKELIHDEHLLKVDLTEESVRSNLIYAIDNLVELQERFRKNNKFLNKFSKEKMLENVTETYLYLNTLNMNGG